MSLPIFASMLLLFITYSLSNHGLATAPVFSSLALFNGLRMPLNLLPLVIGQITDAWSSISRIQEFLLSEEREDEAVIKLDGPNAVEMHETPASPGSGRRRRRSEGRGSRQAGQERRPRTKRSNLLGKAANSGTRTPRALFG